MRQPFGVAGEGEIDNDYLVHDYASVKLDSRLLSAGMTEGKDAGMTNAQKRHE